MNNAVKFRLLMHTRWKVLFRCKGCIFMELVIPFLFIFALAMIRTFIPNTKTPQYTYKPEQIKEVPSSENVRGFCPDNNNVIKDLMSSFPNAKPFASRDKMKIHLKTFNEDEDVGVQFIQKSNDSLDKNISVGLSFGSEHTDWFIGQLFPTSSSNAKFFEPSENAGGRPYYSQHFVPLMYTLAKKIIEKAGKGSKLTNIYIQRFPYTEYKYNEIQNFSVKPSYIFFFALFLPVFVVIVQINREVRTMEKGPQISDKDRYLSANGGKHICEYFAFGLVLGVIYAIFPFALFSNRFPHKRPLIGCYIAN